MKSIKKFINENIVLESKLDFDDVVSELNNVLDYDDFALDSHGNKTGTGFEAVKEVGSIIDVLDFHNMWDELVDKLDCDVDELTDFISDNEDKLMKEIGCD